MKAKKKDPSGCQASREVRSHRRRPRALKGDDADGRKPVAAGEQPLPLGEGRVARHAYRDGCHQLAEPQGGLDSKGDGAEMGRIELVVD